MRLKFIEEKYLLRAPVEECSSLVQKALKEVGLKNMAVKKEVPPRYLLVEYSPGWVGKALEIEFAFEQRRNGAEVSVRWPFASEIPSFIDDKKHVALLKQHEEDRKKATERLIKEFESRIGATRIPVSEQ